MNAGTSDSITAAATKHKSMDTLKRYHHADEATTVEQARNIARKEAKRRRVVEDEKSDDERSGRFNIRSTIFSSKSDDED